MLTPSWFELEGIKKLLIPSTGEVAYINGLDGE